MGNRHVRIGVPRNGKEAALFFKPLGDGFSAKGASVCNIDDPLINLGL